MNALVRIISRVSIFFFQGFSNHVLEYGLALTFFLHRKLLAVMKNSPSDWFNLRFNRCVLFCLFKEKRVFFAILGYKIKSQVKLTKIGKLRQQDDSTSFCPVLADHSRNWSCLLKDKNGRIICWVVNDHAEYADFSGNVIGSLNSGLDSSKKKISKEKMSERKDFAIF